MNNKIIDLFCGCGGLSKGFENAGFTVELALDFWQQAIDTFNFNHKKKVGVCGDIKNLTKQKLLKIKEKGIIGVIGGPPCQGFSTVGKRIVDDPRNSLYQEYCRVVEIINPEFFVLENVKGLTTLAGGAFKEDIIKRFSNLGYTVTFKILNAYDYGVPQNRYRVFFVGMKNKEFKFPKETKKHLTCFDAISDLDFIDEKNGNQETFIYQTNPMNEYQEKMRKNSSAIYNHQITKHSEQTKEIISLIPDGGKIKDLPKEFWTVRKYNKAFERMNSKNHQIQLILVTGIISITKEIESRQQERIVVCNLLMMLSLSSARELTNINK